MKKIFTSFMIALMAIVLFTSCKKDDEKTSEINPSEINAKNVINNGNIFSIRALMTNYLSEDAEDVVIASSKFDDGAFNMSLPTPPEYCLHEIGESFGGFTSDLKAKIGFLDVAAINMKEKVEGSLYLLGISPSYYVDAYYMYSDRNFTIKGKSGSYYYTEECNCSFKKGWNILYYIEDSSGQKDYYTTQKPTGVNLEWVFEDYFDYAYVRFVKEGGFFNCIRMGVANNYYSSTHSFGYGNGTSPYYKIPSGNYDAKHWDNDNNSFIDITNYNFAEDICYSVYCSEKEGGELLFRINEDGPAKSLKYQTPFQINKFSIAKKRALGMNEQ